MEFILIPFIWLMFGAVSLMIANSKGRSGCGWFAAGCLLGPFALVVAALPSLTKPAPPKGYLPCPECKELVHPQAKKCKHCGSALTPALAQGDLTKKLCGSCMRPVSAKEKFCPHCGYNLAAGPIP